MRWKSDLTLLFVAAVWGSGFVAQRLATNQLSAFYFNGGRFLVGALIIFLVMRLSSHSSIPTIETGSSTRRDLPWMVTAGVLLFIASGLQQAGLATTTIGNASFITGLYVVLVPLLLLVIWRQPVSWLSWVAVMLAACGVGLLSMQGEFRLSSGDALELIGAFVWAMHVILVGWLARRGVNVLEFSVIQFTICGLLNMAVALGLTPQDAPNLLTSWQVVLYSAILPIAVGFTLQIFGQKHAPPVDAAIILSMEAVFGTLFGFVFMQESLVTQQLFGCALVLAAMILAQLRTNAPAEAVVNA